MPDIISHLDDYGLYVAAVSAGITGVTVVLRPVIRWAKRMGQTIDALNDLAQYELRPNHGGSIKDHAAQVPQVVERVDALAEQVAGQRQVLDDHLAVADAERRAVAREEAAAMWRAVEAVAKAQPPEEEP